MGLNGNRSDYGPSFVIHDRGDGFGGFGSFFYNKSPHDQFRLVTAIRRDDYQIPNTPDDQASGVRDRDQESDALLNFSWVHSAARRLLFTVSPFYHFNRADYYGGPNNPGLSTLDKLNTGYGGAQVSARSITKRDSARAGIYGYGEHDSRIFGLTATDGRGLALKQQVSPSGGVMAVFLEDQFKVNSWVTVTGGVRLTPRMPRIQELAPRFACPG